MQVPGTGLTPPPRAAQGFTIGARLKQRRAALGLALAAASAATRLPRGQIEAIEAGDFAAFPAHADAVAALRRYARLIGLGEAPLLAMLDVETRGLWGQEEEIRAPRRLRRPGCFWGRHGQISRFG